MNRIIVAGSRGWTDYLKIDHVLRDIVKQDDMLITGGARGVDTLASRWASVNMIKNTIVNAEWDKYGKSAGYLRNQKMAEMATHLIAFWDGKSKGTKHMIDIAIDRGLWVKVIEGI